jgi:hypothetical protein
MELKDFVERALDALQQQYYRVLKGITSSELTWQPFPNTNSIGFIFWHVTRVEDRLIVHFAQGKPEVCPPRTPYSKSKLAVAFFQNFKVLISYGQS